MLQLFLFNVFFAISSTSAMAQMPIEYAYGTHARHKLDVYLPNEPADAPVIIFLHGGGWQSGDKAGRGIWYAKVKHWVPQGYIFVSVNTRLTPEVEAIAQAQDLAQAVGYVQKNLDAWGGDGARVFVMGHSSGAHVAALLSTRIDLREAAGLAPLAGVIALDSAAMDVPVIMADPPFRFYDRAFGDDPAVWAAASPQAHVSGEDPHMLVVCSSFPQGTCDEANRFAQAGAGAGADVDVVEQALSHGDINNKLGTDVAYTGKIDRWMASRMAD